MGKHLYQPEKLQEFEETKLKLKDQEELEKKQLQNIELEDYLKTLHELKLNNQLSDEEEKQLLKKIRDSYFTTAGESSEKDNYLEKEIDTTAVENQADEESSSSGDVDG